MSADEGRYDLSQLSHGQVVEKKARLETKKELWEKMFRLVKWGIEGVWKFFESLVLNWRLEESLSERAAQKEHFETHCSTR